MTKKKKDDSITRSEMTSKTVSGSHFVPSGGIVTGSRTTSSKAEWREPKAWAVDKKGRSIRDSCGQPISGPPHRMAAVQDYVNANPLLRKFKRKPPELRVCHRE